jgi:hypothetical protein
METLTQALEKINMDTLSLFYFGEMTPEENIPIVSAWAYLNGVIAGMKNK